MKKVTIPTNEGIDWSKPQWVQNVKYSDLIVLTTGSKTKAEFSGTAMPCGIYDKGVYATDWVKSNFQPLAFDIPFTISNSNE